MHHWIKYGVVVGFLCIMGIFRYSYLALALEYETGSDIIGIKKIKIAIPPMLSSPNTQASVEGLSEDLIKILRNDLEISGFFDTLKDKISLIAQLDQAERGAESINFDQWRSQTEAQALVKCLHNLQPGKLSLECRVYDTQKAAQILGKAYESDPKQVRKVIHRFADEIILKFTGERGVSDTSLAFVSTRSKNREIYRIDFDGGNLQRLTNDRSIVLSPSWSPDGREILYTSYRNNNPDLFVISANGGEPKPISVQPGLNLGGKWSPDGKQIALTLSKDGNSEIYVLDVSTRSYRRLTKNHWNDVSPSWSPDGKQIAFTSDESGTPQIYIMNSDGSNIRRLSFIGNYSVSPSWSPRGDRIAFAARKNGKFDIYTLSVDGKSPPQQLTFDAGNNEDPVWSRDGRYIAFHSDRDGVSGIYVMNQDGTNQRRVTDFQGSDMSPTWSP
jgi:TolB protein